MNAMYKHSMMKIGAILLLLLVPSLLSAGEMRVVGTTTSFLEKVENFDRLRKSTNGELTFNFMSDQLTEIPVKVRDCILQNGYFALNGTALQSENSESMLKGDEKNIYGWIALHDQNVAYEYTTNSDGIVVVQKVPVSKVIPVCEIGKPSSSSIAGCVSCSNHSKSDRVFKGLLHIGEYKQGTDITKLESRPGHEKVMYLDITRLENNGTPIAPITHVYIWETWQSVAAGLSNFEVNVTTNPAVYKEALDKNVKNTCIARFHNEEGRSNAPLHSFGTTSFSKLYRKPDGYDQGRTGWHEIGHQLGLRHDGTPGNEYYTGIKEFQWVPIMGNYRAGTRWKEALYQWCKGEYTNANQKEDDLNTINSRYLEYRKDDYPNATALVVTENGTVIDTSNFGCIERNTDSDQFTFVIGKDGGSVNLKIDRIEYIGGAQLDVEAEIKDANGTSVKVSNAPVARYAEFKDLKLEEGSYTLEIRGGAEGTPANGFSNYGSLGYYAIEGSITGATSVDKSDVANSKNLGAFISAKTLTYTIPNNLNGVNAEISLYNIKGKLIKTIQKSSAISGQHNLSLKKINVASGYYLCKINVGNSKVALPFIMD